MMSRFVEKYVREQCRNGYANEQSHKCNSHGPCAYDLGHGGNFLLIRLGIYLAQLLYAGSLQTYVGAGTDYIQYVLVYSDEAGAKRSKEGCGNLASKQVCQNLQCFNASKDSYVF